MVTGSVASLPAASGVERAAGPKTPQGLFVDVLREVLAVGEPSTPREPGGQHGKAQGQVPWHGIGLASSMTPPLPAGAQLCGHGPWAASSSLRVGLAAHAGPESFAAETAAEPRIAAAKDSGPASAGSSQTASAAKAARAGGAEVGPQRTAIEVAAYGLSAAERPALASPSARAPGLATWPTPPSRAPGLATRTTPSSRAPGPPALPALAARSAAAAQAPPASARTARPAGLDALASQVNVATEPPLAGARAVASAAGHGTRPAAGPPRSSDLPDGASAGTAIQAELPMRRAGGPAPVFDIGMQSLRHGSRLQAGLAGTHGESGRPLAALAVASSPGTGGAAPTGGSPVADSAQVAAQVAAAAQRAVAGMASGPASVRLQLNPADLGHVQITLRAAQGGIVAVLRADTPAAIAVLQSGQDDLRQRLGALGFKASAVEITSADRPRIVGAASRSPSGRRSG